MNIITIFPGCYEFNVQELGSEDDEEDVVDVPSQQCQDVFHIGDGIISRTSISQTLNV